MRSIDRSSCVMSEEERLANRRRNHLFQMSRSQLLLAYIGLVCLSSLLSFASAEDAYQQLVEHGFPTGLLPNTVTGYTLHDDGSFQVFLQDKCNIYIPGEFPVTYSKIIAGNLAYGSLTNLSGITVKAYYFWWSINAITVSNGNLVFVVGLLTAKFPLDNFDESPGCAKKSLLMAVLDE